jgi:hypothetical protein
MTRLGVRAKNPTVNSSTTKGAEALAGEFQQRRCRIANSHRRWVGEVLLPSTPRNRGRISAETMPRREPGTYGDGLKDNTF